LKGGIRATAKLAHYRDKYSPDSNDLKTHRVVMIPPVDRDWSTVAEPVDKLYDTASDLLTYAAGGHGGMMTLHPYRHADEPDFDDIDDLDEVSDSDLALIDSQDDRGVWKHTLPDWDDGHTPDWEETRARLVFEPHLHCYVVSEYFFLDTARIYEETGWIIVRLEPYEGNSVSCYGIEDLSRSVMYALSHSAHIEDRDHFRYYGAIANESASEAQKRRASRVCRSYSGHVLGLSESGVTCKRDVSDDDETSAQKVVSGGGTGSADSSDDDDANAERTPCGGRLRHWKQIPDLIEKRDWPDEVVNELEELYEELSAEPPP
jgi:hypothetical protein